MMQRLRELPPLKILLAVAAAATIMLILATGVGVMAALVVGLGPGSSGGESDLAGRTEYQREASTLERTQPRQAGNGKSAPDRLSEAEYVSTVGHIQRSAVKTLLDSHDKLLRYDILTVDDVAQLQANESALRELIAQVDDLNPPQKYTGQYKEYRSAIKVLHEAARLAYSVVANPTAATKGKFDKYDRRVDEAAGRLQQSNEILGRDYRTIGDVQEISPL
jgi:hypothetical protein